MSKKQISWILLILLSIIWGSSFILMKKGMYTDEGNPIFSSNQVGAIRMLIASIVMLPFAFLRLRKIKKKHIIGLLIVCFIGNVFPAFLFPFAETGVSSGLTGMLNSFTPIFTLLIGIFMFKMKTTKNQLIGILIATIGVVLLSLLGKQAQPEGSWIHIGAIILATFFYALNLSVIKYKLNDLKALDIASFAFLFIFPFALFSFFYFEVEKSIIHNPFAYEGLFYISILAIIGTSIALVIFNRIIEYSSTIFASSVTYFIPIVAFLIGVLYGEKIGFVEFTSLIILLIGILFTNKNSIKKNI